MATSVQRELPDEDAKDLLALVRDICDSELLPKAADFEHREEFPREVFRTLGRSGLLTLAHSEEYGGGGLPQVVYLQVFTRCSGTMWQT